MDNTTSESEPQKRQRRRVIFVGVGGATCSGKTTLAKYMCKCIPDSILVHQDDFAPPQELVPIHPKFNVQDWDNAPTAIDWPSLKSFIATVQSTGAIPDSHKSHDHLNEQKDVPLDLEAFERWKARWDELKSQWKERGEEVTWVLVDGFLLYWDPFVVSALDARLFLRVPCDVLKQRRHERHGYHTAVQSDPEGSLWRDPPSYFDDIVYPAYQRAHERVFENGNVETGVVVLPSSGADAEKSCGDPVEDLRLFDCETMSMDEIFERACEIVWEASQPISNIQGRTLQMEGEEEKNILYNTFAK